jgi:hypothetical protein
MSRSERPLRSVLLAACGAACALASAAGMAQAADAPMRLALPRGELDAAQAARPAAADGALRPALPRRESALGGARLIEVPRDGVPGAYGRPRYALGFRSEALRGFMNDIGIEATSCLAPVVRLRTRISSDGDFSGAIWIYARCSIR